MNDSKKIRDLPVILFPHSHLAEGGIRKILSFFGPLTIFQPWFMGRPHFTSEAADSTGIRVLNPPDSINPGEDFSARLAEYRDWIKYHADKSYTDFIKVGRFTEPGESTTWEIRQMVRGTGSNCSKSEKAYALKWHLILHLAREFEEQRAEADRMLRAMKEKDSILKGLIGGEDEGVNGLLEDLPQFASDPLTREYHLKQITEAWFSLFGGYMKGDALLITFNSHLMDYVSQLWEDFTMEDKAFHATVLHFNTPDLSHHSLEDLVDIRRKRFSNEKIEKLKSLLLNLGKETVGDLTALYRITEEAERTFPWELSEGSLHVTVKHLPTPSNSQLSDKDEVSKHFFDKTLVFMGDASLYE